MTGRNSICAVKHTMHQSIGFGIHNIYPDPHLVNYQKRCRFIGIQIKTESENENKNHTKLLATERVRMRRGERGIPRHR